MKKPIIGITAYGLNQHHRYDMPYGYVFATRKAGGIPILIPPGDHPKDYLHLVDGIILAGGGDINPKFYDGSNHHTIYNTNEQRDLSEFELVKLLLRSKLPIFAICRGLQVVNVACGGTLHEHLPSHYGDKVLHRSADAKQVLHKVIIEPETFLSKLLKTDETKIASIHHQCIKKLGENLVVTATSEDGVIEAVEMPNHPWFLGVQWHPELTAANDPLQQSLFDAMVKFIKGKK